MAEMFHLGFEIDTRPLAQTSTEAIKAADAVGKLGDAERKLSTDAQQATEAQKRANDETSKAAKAARDAAAAKQAAGKSAQDYEQSLRQMTGTMKVSQQDMQGLVAALRGQGGLVGGLESASGVLGRVGAALGPVGLGLAAASIAALAAYAGFKKLAEPLAAAQDQMGLFDARMRNALGSTSAATQTMGQLYESTQKTGLGFRETADAFLRLARNGEALGASRAQLIQLTDVVQKLGAVSGASRGEIGSGMLQLSQALASGRLNGDELRSIMENMPALAKAIADNLGVGIGQLRQMGAAGELSGDKVFQALLRASNKANEEFAKLPDTVERANQRSADAWDRLLATLGQKWNASGFVVGVTDFFTKMVNKANAALQPDNLGSQIAGLEARRAAFAKLPGVDAERQRRSLDGQIARLRLQASSEMRQFSEANEAEEKRLAFAGIKRAVELGGNEYDDFEKKVKKARDEAQQLEDAIGNIQIRIKTGLADPSERSLLPALRRQAANAKAELYDLAGVLEKAKRDLNDARLAQVLGGGGGGTGIVTQAQKQAEQARTKGGGSVQQFIDLGVEQALIKGNEQIATMDRQTEAQRRLAQTVGMTRAEVIEFEVANERANKRLELLGTLGGKKAEEWANRYADALRRSKQAADDLANAQARLGLTDQIASAQAALANVGNPYAGRLAANELQAGVAARRDPAQAALIRQLFGIQEQTSAASLIDNANRNAAFNRSVLGFGAGGVRAAELERRISDAQRGVRPEDREALAASMRSEDESQRTREYDQQQRALERQVRLIADREKLIGLAPEEFRVQNALLEKRNQLEQAGAPREVIDRQMAITEQIERQTIAYEKQKSKVDGIINVVGRAADSFGGAFQNALEKGFSDGTKAGLRQFEFDFRTAIRRMGAELTYEIAIRPFVEAIKNMALTFGQKLAGSLFGGGGSLPSYNVIGTPQAGAALGMGFDYGGARRFAAGGAFTNSIVSQPTLFAFAGGGALGLMGEAGPEAIMPLKRGRDGSLGVVGGGGGDVQVIINDMRQNTEAPPIKVAESRGPDNRRVLQVMVRDEVRRVVRSGELDTEMYSNFGVSRSVARK